MARYYLDLFSGVGGFALGADWAGLTFDGHYFSEVDDYAISVYKKHFNNAIPLGDITKIDYAKLPSGDKNDDI
jgi:DNA (cytosine-5)-methyltransferase 1